MALPDLTGLNIEDTYERVLHTDGISLWDGTGSLVVLQYTGSFTGDGSQLTGIVATSNPAGPDQSIQFRDGAVTSGSGNFIFDKNSDSVSLIGNLFVYTDGGATNNIDSQQRILFDQVSTQSINWDTRELIDPNKTNSVNWSTRVLLDQSANASIDWNNYELKDGSTSVNWTLRFLYSTAGVSVDYQSGHLFDNASTFAINWPDRYLFDRDGRTSIYWDRDRAMFDTKSSQSIDWGVRRLLGVDGTTPVLSWNNITGSLIGTSSWANNSVTASFINGGTF